MSKEVKSKLHETIDAIEDQSVLNQIMTNVKFLASENDVVDSLNETQLMELDEAISEADKGEVISLADFKKELNEWKQK